MKVLILILILILILFALPAFADDDCRGNHNCGNGGGSTPIDINIDTVTEVGGPTVGGDNTDIITTALGDVDINDCLYSWQFLIVQGVKANKFCQLMGLANDQQLLGNYYTAAKLKCKLKIIKDVWGTELECINALKYVPPKPPKKPKIMVPTSGPPDVVMEQLAEQAEGYNSLEQRVARVETANQISARKAQERRDYAKQTIQKVMENDPEE